MESDYPNKKLQTFVNQKPGKQQFWRKQENAASYEVRLRGWQVTESDGDASQVRYVPK